MLGNPILMYLLSQPAPKSVEIEALGETLRASGLIHMELLSVLININNHY